MSFTKLLDNGAEFLLTKGRRAILENPKFNLAMVGELKKTFNQFTDEYREHGLHMFVGYQKDLVKSGMWGKFIGTKENPGFRSTHWKNHDFFLAIDQNPTVHVLLSKFRTTARGTVVEPIATSRVLPIAGNPRLLHSDGTNLTMIEPEFPTLQLRRTTNLNYNSWAGTLSKLEVNNPNGFLDGFKHITEVSGVFIRTDMQQLQLARYVSGVPKQVQLKLKSQYLSEVTGRNWGPAANSGKDTFGFGAVHPHYFDYDDVTKQVIPLFLGDEAAVAKVLARPNEPWVPLDTFLTHYKPFKEHATAGKPHTKFDWSTGTSMLGITGIGLFALQKSSPLHELTIEHKQAS